MSVKEKLGKNIKKIRTSKKITQEKFAEMIGIDPKNISKIENGKNYPSPETLTKIKKALDIDFYELFMFDITKDKDEIKAEIIKALDDEKTLLYLYQKLKMM